jgi:hypothetical protein
MVGTYTLTNVRQTEYSHHYYTLLEKYVLSSSGRKSRLCVSTETVEVAFFLTGLETLQLLGVEKSIHVGFSLPNCCYVASLHLLS